MGSRAARTEKAAAADTISSQGLDVAVTATKGRRFEHEIRELFRRAGFSVVRGAGSKGQMLEEKVDLVATKSTRQNSFTCFLTSWEFSAR